MGAPRAGRAMGSFAGMIVLPGSCSVRSASIGARIKARPPSGGERLPLDRSLASPLGMSGD